MADPISALKVYFDIAINCLAICMTAADYCTRQEARCCMRGNDISIGIETMHISGGCRYAVLMLVGTSGRSRSASAARCARPFIQRRARSSSW